MMTPVTTYPKAAEHVSGFGSERIYYNNFASHLQNRYNPNMFYPLLPNRWSDEDWFGLIDMIEAFGYTAFEFWLEPCLFSREGLDSDMGHEFSRQMRAVIAYANTRNIRPIMLCSLATVGSDWMTLCPNDSASWKELQDLWRIWLQRLPDLGGVDIFPGDPGACSRNGCTAETFIDRACDIAALVRISHPDANIILNTWGPPFFGWGNIKGPEGWKGEFLQSWQHTAWAFDKSRADRAMAHLLRRLPEYPDQTSVAINLGFNPDGNPEGEQDARGWISEIATTHRVQTWDFSLTEGENNVVPHYRFARLFAQRQREQEIGAYSGGICFTMTPRLNQLSIYVSAQSFCRPNADPDEVVKEFLITQVGPAAEELAVLLPLFEVIPDWGNYHKIHMPRPEYHAKLCAMLEIFEGAVHSKTATDHPFPFAASWAEEHLFFARLFADLSAPSPDYDALYKRYWQHVYAIYDHLPEHVDPRPRQASKTLIQHFMNWDLPADATPIPGKWT